MAPPRMSSLFRGSRLVWLPLFFLAFCPSRTEGQLSLVGSAVYTEALQGQWGIDGRLGVDLSALPVGFFGGVDYFFADCQEACSLWGWRAGAILHTATPVVQPYLTGAYLERVLEERDASQRHLGLAFGGGIRVEAALQIQAEATWEFLGGKLNQWVFRIGLGL